MRRLFVRARFLGSAAGRLTRARRALHPRLPARTGGRATGVAVVLWLRAATKLPLPVPTLQLLVNGRSHDVHVQDESEFFGSFEVFSTGDYAIEIGRVRRVLDLGANVGFASMLFVERYPQATVVAVEAAPDTFARLEANTGNMPTVRTLRLAIGTDGPLRIDIALPSAERRTSSSGVEVEGKSLTTLLDDLGWDHVDLMKIDIEGAELAVFADSAMSRVRAIVGEVHGPDDPRVLLPNYDVEMNAAVGSTATMFRAVRTPAR